MDIEFNEKGYRYLSRYRQWQPKINEKCPGTKVKWSYII